MELIPRYGPSGWLLINLIVTIGLLSTYRLIPPVYRQTVLNVRWVLLPYLALVTGNISPRFMGLTGIDWLLSFSFGLGLIAAVLGLLLLVRSTTDFSPPTNRANPWPATARAAAQPPLPNSPRAGATGNIQTQPNVAISLSPLINAGAEEFYWSFLRGTLWEISQTIPAFADQAGYWAIWLAVGVALPEIFRFHQSLPNRLFKVILLLLTTVLFIYTQNFWLCWLLHTLVLILLIP